MEKTNETPFAIDSQMVMRFRCYFNFEITSTHQQKYSSLFFTVFHTFHTEVLKTGHKNRWLNAE